MRGLSDARFHFCPGFTLIEVLLACAIAAVLAGIVTGATRHAIEVGEVTRARQDLARLAVALERYRRSYGDYPQTSDAAELLRSMEGQRGPSGDLRADPALIGLEDFVVGPAGDGESVILDPWRRPYIYIYKVPLEGWTNPSFVLASRGPTGASPAPLLQGGFIDADAPENASVVLVSADEGLPVGRRDFSGWHRNRWQDDDAPLRAPVVGWRRFHRGLPGSDETPWLRTIPARRVVSR